MFERTLVPEYEQYRIPLRVWNFFSTEEGLNTNLLIDIKNDEYRRVICSMINSFSFVTFPLIKFYRDTPELSIKDLLQYGEYTIRDLAVHDKNFEFHKWLLKHNFTMPKCLVDNWMYIYYFCKPDGIEYLNRKFSTASQDEFESELELLLKDHIKFRTDLEETLRDYLANNQMITDKSPTLWNQKENKLSNNIDYEQLDAAFSSFLKNFIK